jgi:hypothetical protein
VDELFRRFLLKSTPAFDNLNRSLSRAGGPGSGRAVVLGSFSRLFMEEFIRSPEGELRPLREVRRNWAFGLGSLRAVSEARRLYSA